jgi:hypothetical protein
MILLKRSEDKKTLRRRRNRRKNIIKINLIGMLFENYVGDFM